MTLTMNSIITGIISVAWLMTYNNVKKKEYEEADDKQYFTALGFFALTTFVFVFVFLHHFFI